MSQTADTIRKSMPNHVLLPQVEQLLRQGRSVRLRTRGISMLPFIIGSVDSVLLRPATAHPRRGQIVLARTLAGHYVLHRVLHTHADGSVTLRGDGNLSACEHCRADAVCGTAVSLIRPGRPDINLYSPMRRHAAAVWMRLPALLRRIVLAVFRHTYLRRMLRRFPNVSPNPHTP